MQDYYRVNVSLDGKHLFATEKGGITTESEARRIIRLFQLKFQETEGFDVTCIHWKCRGESI